MDVPTQMMVFATVVEQGSISEAARRLGQTPSAVSKQIGLLENQARHRLLNRIRTGVSPTDEGQLLYQKCRDLAVTFREAQALLSRLDDTPRGNLRIASTVAFGQAQLIPALPIFFERNPEVQIELELTDRDIDLRAEGYDAVVCFEEHLRRPDIVVRNVMHSRRVLCASPDYLKKFGAPKHISDLGNHNCLRLAGSSLRNTWNDEETDLGESFEPRGSFVGNSTNVIYRAALAGLGIARLPCYMTDPKIQSGELVRVLPEYSPMSTNIVVTFAERQNLSPRTRAFVDFLAVQFRRRSTT